MLSRSIRKFPVAILALGLLFAINASSAFAAPSATTVVATEVAGTAATLNGTVAADSGHTTRYAFGYGTSSNISEFTGDTPVGTTTSSSPIDVSAHITGLTPETTYYYTIGAFDTVTNEMVTGTVGRFKTTADNGIGFYAAEYPATVSGSLGSETVFQAAGGKFQVKCPTRTLSGTLSSASNSLGLTPTFSSCRAFGSYGATVKMNSCSFVASATLHWGIYSGGLVISCSTEGDGIEFITTAGCNVKVSPSDLSGTAVNYENTGPPTARQLSLDGWANYLNWTVNNRFVCAAGGIPASGGDGTIGPGLEPPNNGLTGTILKGTNSRGAYNEFYVAG